MAKLSDADLLDIATKIGDDIRMINLAAHLEIPKQAVKKYQDEKERNPPEGTNQLLIAWRRSVPAKDQRTKLKLALERADLAGIADMIVKGKKIVGSSDNKRKMSDASQSGIESQTPKARKTNPTSMTTPKTSTATKPSSASGSGQTVFTAPTPGGQKRKDLDKELLKNEDKYLKEDQKLKTNKESYDKQKKIVQKENQKLKKNKESYDKQKKIVDELKEEINKQKKVKREMDKLKAKLAQLENQ